MYFSDYKKHKDAKLRPSLFWEYDFDKIDFQKMRTLVVQRVLERGRLEDFYAIINMYGMRGVKSAFCDIKYMNAKDMNFVCVFFNIKKENLKCYTQKQSTPQLWNS